MAGRIESVNPHDVYPRIKPRGKFMVNSSGEAEIIVEESSKVYPSDLSRRDNKIKSLRLLGQSHSEIGQILNLSHFTVSKLTEGLIKTGDLGRYNRKKIDEEVKALRLAGKTTTEIESLLPWTESAIRHSVGRLRGSGEIEKGHSYRGEPIDPTSTRAKLLALLKEIADKDPDNLPSLGELGKTLGVSRQRVKQLYDALSKSQNLPPRRSVTARGKENKVKKLIESGAGFIEIGHRLRNNPRALGKEIGRLARLGRISRVPSYQEERNFRREVLVEEISHMLRKGMTFDQIDNVYSKQSGFGASQMRDIYKKYPELRKRRKRRSKKDALLSGLI